MAASRLKMGLEGRLGKATLGLELALSLPQAFVSFHHPELRSMAPTLERGAQRVQSGKG